MAAALNKRQQARNERTLQELIKTVPGNSTCADCGARNPGWASWSLGIFLCMRCAALHRKLGTHISKVKSLSMDKWDNAQVDNMKRIGNVESNKSYNPRNVKAQIPIDVDEVDSAMERYIRQKYQERIFLTNSQPGTRHNTGSTSSAEDRPPPLPPKPTKRFGFGIQKSSTFPRNSTPPISPGLGGFDQEPSPPRVNKPSRVFGSSITTSGDGLESKLATLRDMGFPDEKRNSTVLKGLNGNLDRAVEALIRLGDQNTAKSREHTPTPPAKPAVNGISVDQTATAPASLASMNPFDALDYAAPQPQQQPQPAPLQTQNLPYGAPASHTASSTNSYNPFLTQQVPTQQQGYPQQQPQQQHQQSFAQYQNPYNQQQQYQNPPGQQPQQQNPFGQPQQQQNPYGQQQPSQYDLEQSFQSLQLSNQHPQQQQLFPNRTGGHSQPQTPQYPQTNPFQQSFTPPPMPQIPQQYASFYQPEQTQYQPMVSPTSAGNPFLKSTKSQIFAPSTSGANPFGQNQQISQQQQSPAPNPFMTQGQAPMAHQPSANTWQDQNQQSYQQQTAQSSYQQPQFQQQNYQQQPQGAFNKNSILALYNYPQLAPQRSEPAAPAPDSNSGPAQAPAAPAPGNMNPFAGAQGAGQGPPPASAVPPSMAHNQGSRHVSNESVDFAGLMGGRHSPDAFSGLSASFRR